ncbi:MAG: PhoH family protein [Deltaproteobacteria bacterium]|nr:PhoH family protein [Deltaproteobacteria bacterium]
MIQGYFKKINGENVSVKTLRLTNHLTMTQILGDCDRNLKRIEKAENLSMTLRGNELSIAGESYRVDLVYNLFTQLDAIVQKGYPLYDTDVEYAHRILSDNAKADLESIFLDTVFISSKKKIITPKSLIQKRYIDSIRDHDIVFGIGPAGTGKTYLAMAMAVSYLLDKKVNRIILTRPAVEAGEKLGFLPGDLAEKVNPYLRPVYDAMYDMIDFERASALIHKGIIEVAPLAFMRGRTLNDAFVILDEAQNTTSEQMKMFLTRLGFGSKAVITGDVTQTDLPPDKKSGLKEVEGILINTEGIKFIYFSDIDVVRHPIVQEIIRAYNHLDKTKESKGKSN